MSLIETLSLDSFKAAIEPQQQQQAVNALESGKVLLFPKLSFEVYTEELQFLTPSALAPKRKNISYDCASDQLKGDIYQAYKHQQLQAMLRRFAADTRALLVGLFPGYVEQLQQARTSYRVVEAADREELSDRKDDRRLHVDAFPTTPTQGKRILRVFSNLNPANKPRVWRIADGFERVAERYVDQVKSKAWWKKHFLHKAKLTKGLRTSYDELMLQLHDLMKTDESFQQGEWVETVNLPAQSTWMVFTDQVPHAVLSGQFCLEQTFHLPVSVMTNPSLAPLSILERAFQRELA